MKKILVIALSLLFAASAFAVEVKLTGYHELEGRMMTNNALVEKNEKTASHYYQQFRIFAALKVDEQTTATFRFHPINDRIWGGTEAQNDMKADRYWITYQLNDMVKVSGGKMTSENYYVQGFGSINANANYIGQASGGFEQVQLDVAVAEGMNVFAIVRKVKETSSNNDDLITTSLTADKTDEDTGDVSFLPAKNVDQDAYILGAKLNLGAVTLLPSFGYHTDLQHKDFSATKVYLGAIADAGMVTISGAFAMDMTSSKDLMIDNNKKIDVRQPKLDANGLPELAADGSPKIETVSKDNPGYGKSIKDSNGKQQFDNKSDYSLFGLFVQADIAVNDTINAGAAIAYGSSDKGDAKKGHVGRSFAFGDDFDKTYIIDSQYYDLDGKADGTTGGPAGGLGVYAFADVQIMPALTLNAMLGYYKSMVDKGHAIDVDEERGEESDLQAVELDLALAYEFTPATTFTLGVAYANVTGIEDLANEKSRVTSGNVDKVKYKTYDANATAVYWNAYTKF